MGGYAKRRMHVRLFAIVIAACLAVSLCVSGCSDSFEGAGTWIQKTSSGTKTLVISDFGDRWKMTSEEGEESGGEASWDSGSNTLTLYLQSPQTGKTQSVSEQALWYATLPQEVFSYSDLGAETLTGYAKNLDAGKVSMLDGTWVRE